MLLDFVKLNGCGNDFIFFDGINNNIELTSEQVIKLCDRNFGIGADGVIVVEPNKEPNSVAFMNYINSDGTFAQMCGNGVRCFAKYLVDRKIVNPIAETFDVDTRAGVRKIKYELDSDNRLSLATVDMGMPILEPAKIPVNINANAKTSNGVEFVSDALIESPWGGFKFTCVSMGNPHAVCFIEDFSSLDDALFSDSSDKSIFTFNIESIGSFYESNPVFPEKVNVEFATLSDNGIDMRVYERGCGETLACGTGACATSVAATLTRRAGRDNTVRLLGGDLNINWLESGSILMTGPAEESFYGTVNI